MSENDYQPIISIIVATLNAATKVEKTLKSIITQTYPLKELIVIDGGSIDETIPILLRYQQHISYWESNKDHGIYHAWNKALDHVNGEWICFLGADDYFWDSDVLEKMIPHFNSANQNDYKYLYGKSNIFDNKGSILYVEGKPWHLIKNQFIRNLPPFVHSGSFHHISLFRTYGKLDDSFRIAGDHEFLLRYLSDGNAAYFADDVIVAGLPVGGISRNLDNHIEVALESLRAIHRHSDLVPWPLLIILFQRYIFAVIKKVYGRRNAARIADLYREKISGKQKMWLELAE